MTGARGGAPRVLYWGDSPAVATGFGVVARHVLGALHAAGLRVNCLTVNSPVDFVDPEAFPYPMAAAAASQNDRVGASAFARALSVPAAPALALVQNDLAATHVAAAHVTALRQRGSQVPPILHYFPVDCGVRKDFSGMLLAADVNVTCTSFGRRETLEAFPDRAPLVIPHGVDTATFRPLPERKAVRQLVRNALKVSDEALLLCSVASNNARKDLPRTLAAFAAFRAQHLKPSVLYLHTLPFSNGIDLNAAASACDLVVGRDVLFPPNYHPLAAALEDRAMNELYNACDWYFTTTLGEGWCLPVTEAMAAGLPVVAPKHSALAEHGANGRATVRVRRANLGRQLGISSFRAPRRHRRSARGRGFDAPGRARAAHRGSAPLCRGARLVAHRASMAIARRAHPSRRSAMSL